MCIATRMGKHIEIGNTDAEGRLVLCDALAMAMESSPDLVLDFATLTGAARVAWGRICHPCSARCQQLADGLVRAGTRQEDLLWQLPLHSRYLDMITSEIADLNNSGKNGFAGCHHRGPVPGEVCRQQGSLGAYRHLCLEPHRQALEAGRWRGAGAASSLCLPATTLRRLGTGCLRADEEAEQSHRGGHEHQQDHVTHADGSALPMVMPPRLPENPFQGQHQVHRNPGTTVTRLAQ